jgi:hypothetical protein
MGKLYSSSHHPWDFFRGLIIVCKPIDLLRIFKRYRPRLVGTLN